MLTNLRIKNLALVDDLAIQFGPGYNAVTGETGAGKSIIIGAADAAAPILATRISVNLKDMAKIEEAFPKELSR